DADTTAETSGDGDGDQAVTINFGGQVGDAAVACGATFDEIGSASTSIELRDFRFYVSDVELIGAAGAVPIVLDQGSPWQNERVALLDFEDGTGLCQDSGTAELNSIVTGTVPAGEYS